jgi:hypothetical protein
VVHVERAAVLSGAAGCVEMQIIPDDAGGWQLPWFFFTREYWNINKEKDTTEPMIELIRKYVFGVLKYHGTNQRERQSIHELTSKCCSNEDASAIDEDVRREDDESRHEGSGAVRIVRLSKTYRSVCLTHCQSLTGWLAGLLADAPPYCIGCASLVDRYHHDANWNACLG